MDKLKKLKLRDLSLDSIRPMSTSNGSVCTCSGSETCSICEGDTDPVEIWGSSGSSGSVNSAATCRRCGTPYDGWGMCPKCDTGSSGSGDYEGSGSDPWGSGSGSDYGSGGAAIGGGGSTGVGNPGNNNPGDGCIGVKNFPIPEQTQIMPGECLANCITQLLKSLGVNTSLDVVMLDLVKMGCDPINQGLKSEQSMNAIKKYFKINIHENWNQLQTVLNNGKPILSVIIDPKNPTVFHSVVITGYGQTNDGKAVIRYYDPYYTTPKYALFRNDDGSIPFGDFIEITAKK